MKDEARHSRYLFEIMDRFLNLEDYRMVQMRLTRTFAIVKTATDKLIDDDAPTFYTFGSMSDGTAGLESDIDMLQCNEIVPVVDRPDDGPASDICLLTVCETNTPAGYTKLQVVEDRHPLTIEQWELNMCRECTVDGRGRLMRNHHTAIYKLSKRPYEIIGPATRVQNFDTTCDMVSAYRYRKWPAIAMEWKSRVRCYNCPSTAVVKQLCSLGCFLVPKGHSQSSDVDLEWRFSFALQEHELMRSLNAVQFKCYVLLKRIKTYNITAELGESITSYHCKTCIFYAIESKTANFWTPDNLITCIHFCLSILHEWLEKEFCPNYFIREDNMFEKMLHGGLLAKTANLLEKIMEHNYDLKTDGILVDKMINMIPTNQDIDMVLLCADILLGATLIYIRRLLKYTLFNNDPVPCIEAHNKLIRKLTNMKTVAGYTKEQTTDSEVIDLILPYLYTSLASNEAAQLLQFTTEGPETERIKSSMYEHIERGLKSCIISCQLKVAAIHYMLGEYEASEKIMSAAPLMLHKGTRKNVCNCSALNNIILPRNDVCVDDQMLSGFKSGTVPLSELLKSSFSTCVMFLPTEKAIAPSAMLYTVVHEAVYIENLDGPGSTDIGVGKNWAVVDFNAFGYYMQYLVHDKLGKTNEKRLAVKNLKQLINEDEILAHKKLASKLLDWILETEKSY